MTDSSKPARTLSIVALVAMLALASPAFADRGGESPPRSTGYRTTPIDPGEVESWRADLARLVQELERIHPDPYRKIGKGPFTAERDRLNARIPELAAHEIVVGFARLLALVGDGHTSLPLYAAQGVDFHVLPYRVGLYDDGLWIEGADRGHSEIVGGRVISIGGISADEAVERVATLISRDNHHWIRAVAPHLLDRIEVLHALGMASDLSGTTVTVVDRDGRRVQRRVEPLADPQHATHGLPYLPRHTGDWVDASPEYSRAERAAFDQIYGWRYLEEEDLLHIRFDQVQNRHGGPSALETFREAMAFARERSPGKTLIDIRNNTGGNGGLLPPIVREIVRTREVDQPGRLYLAIGNRTFSAAQMLTSMLERFSTAILVGEPSGAAYNEFAGHEFVELPHSGVRFAVSPDHYQMGAYPRDPRRRATPRLAASSSFEDYASGRDRVREVVLAHDGDEEDRLIGEVMASLRTGDDEAARRLARGWDARPVNRYFDSSAALNRAGYRLLRDGSSDAAIQLFRLNVELHPAYANGWDSLGEALVHAGRKPEAREAFVRALELDPRLESSLQWLQRLERKH